MRRLRDPASSDYEAAIRDTRRLFRYAVARWGASPAVAVWEYWNEIDPSLPAGRFCRELAAFLDQTDPWRRPRTASAWAPAPALWRDPAIQMADLHWYLRPAWGQLWTDAAAAVLERAAFLRHHAPDRPAILSEFGIADDQWRHSPWMRQDTALRHVHDALWASALSGLGRHRDVLVVGNARGHGRGALLRAAREISRRLRLDRRRGAAPRERAQFVALGRPPGWR